MISRARQSTVDSLTMAPAEPCARPMPAAGPIPWLTSTVVVPPRLPKAPTPFGTTTKRHGEPSALVAPSTASPALSRDTKRTFGSDGTR